MERKISAEETTVLSCERPKHGMHLIDSYYDCPTCAYWLAEASQCTEKSCKKCISLLRNEQSIPYSPVNGEYKSLNNGGSSGGGGGGTDTRSGRESFDVLKCCDNIKTSTESNSPLNRCMARYRDEDYINCQFALVGCSFRTIDLNQLNIHNEENIYKHMNMMVLHITKNTTKDVKTTHHLANKNENENCQQNVTDGCPSDVKKLHDRVTTLEQELREYKLDVKRLTVIINKISISNLRERFGTLIWQIDEFEKKVQTMLNNPMTMFYSPDFYTDPNGYRFCGRISISSKSKIKDYLSFHVHMMQSENDFHLDWPFRGCIQIFMIHEDNKLTQRDKIMTNEKSTAFQRPTSEISAHSFGFTEYANISNIMNEGFLSGDGKLTIKLHISIV